MDPVEKMAMARVREKARVRNKRFIFVIEVR